MCTAYFVDAAVSSSTPSGSGASRNSLTPQHGDLQGFDCPGAYGRAALRVREMSRAMSS
jgi:hypothetical protein